MSASKGGSGWVNAYVERSAEREASSDKPHLHQTAGWYDIADVADWRAYVHDVVAGCVPKGARVFEAGCGVLAFLAEVRSMEPSVSLHGVDGSEPSIRVVHEEVAPAMGIDGQAFRVGLLPGALASDPSDAYDLTLCNSVLQYLPERDCWQTAEELLRMTRPGGTTILADVCDAAFREEEEKKLAEFWQGYGTELPSYTYFAERAWYERFEGRAEVRVRRVAVESYRRRRSRYVVSLRKR